LEEFVQDRSAVGEHVDHFADHTEVVLIRTRVVGKA
jgi:hypothetical protein